jgi:hypothetical protein
VDISSNRIRKTVIKVPRNTIAGADVRRRYAGVSIITARSIALIFARCGQVAAADWTTSSTRPAHQAPKWRFEEGLVRNNEDPIYARARRENA